MSSNDQGKKLNTMLTRRVALPTLSEQLGEEFFVVIRRLSGQHIKLFEEMPDEVYKLKDANIDVSLKTFPWLKKLVMAAVVKPRLTDKSIGDHEDDELSVDALEMDLYTVINEVLELSGLAPKKKEDDEEEVAPALPFRPGE